MYDRRRVEVTGNNEDGPLEDAESAPGRFERRRVESEINKLI